MKKIFSILLLLISLAGFSQKSRMIASRYTFYVDSFRIATPLTSTSTSDSVWVFRSSDSTTRKMSQSDFAGGGGGSGTVNTGTANRLAYYPASNTTVDDLSAITANRLLISDANGLPTHSSVTNTEAGYLSGVTSALQTQIDGKQATDADLTALAALSGTNNIYYRSASNTWSSVTIGSGLSFSSGTLSASGGGGASTALDNLASVAINTSLISDANNTDDLGSSTNSWKDVWAYGLYLRNSSSGYTAISSSASTGSIGLFLPASGGTLSNRISSGEASNATPTPTGNGVTNFYNLTALATNATFAAPSGTAIEHNLLWIIITDNGTSRTLAWNAIYDEGSDIALPTSTVTGESIELQFRYHTQSSKWRLVGLVGGF